MSFIKSLIYNNLLYIIHQQICINTKNIIGDDTICVLIKCIYLTEELYILTIQADFVLYFRKGVQIF